MKNWKTTLFGFIAAGAAFVLFANQAYMIDFPRWVLALAAFIGAGGVAGLGLAAKDSDVTGGERGQPSTVRAMLAANQQPLDPDQMDKLP